MMNESADLPISPIIRPYSWLFGRSSRAFAAVASVIFITWIAHVLVRIFIFSEKCYLGDELTLLVAFISACGFSLALPRLFCNLCDELVQQRSSLADTFRRQYDAFHDLKWTLWIPVGVALIALAIQQFAAGSYPAFDNFWIETSFMCWLFLGFYFILLTTVLCARYTEIVKLLENEAAEGTLGRSEIYALSGFYLKIALIASIHFGLCALLAYSLYIIYMFRGAMAWTGFDLIRWHPGLSLGDQIEKTFHDPLFLEVAVFFSLHGAVSVAPLVYLVFPQWGIHKLLVRRKEGLAGVMREKIDHIEEKLSPQSADSDFEEFARLTRIADSIEKMPEWPFNTGGKLGTICLVIIPSILLLAKEFLLEGVASLLFK